eukprot:6565173-Prymnesium_polylepis.1
MVDASPRRRALPSGASRSSPQARARRRRGRSACRMCHPHGMPGMTARASWCVVVEAVALRWLRERAFGAAAA